MIISATYVVNFANKSFKKGAMILYKKVTKHILGKNLGNRTVIGYHIKFAKFVCSHCDIEAEVA